MDSKLSTSAYFVLGATLFALFFGAGNLIFPAQLGQYAGENLWPAAIGFAITGVGLPLMGILAIGYSGSNHLHDLASRVHPIYGLIFTVMLYLTIGPFFAAPRTGAVAYEIGISPFVGDGNHTIALFIFTLLYFGASLLLSLNPTKVVDRVGKILSPALIFLLFILLIMAVVNPMGNFGEPQGEYADNAFMTGFKEGYNTMDALASLVFGIIIINAIQLMGIKSSRGILKATSKAGIVAVVLLGSIYLGIAYLGATSTDLFGLFDTGGPVLSGAASHYLGTTGMVLLAILIILACLTTSIGLMTAISQYFHRLMPQVSYKTFVTIFTTLTFIIANFGLANIINYSIPVLMLLYPLAIVLMILAFVSPLFNHARLVYASTIAVTFLISVIDGLKTFCELFEMDYFSWMVPIISFYEKVLPFYQDGLGWLLPVVVVMIVTGVIARVQQANSVQTQ
ncbi:MAG TPA: branched-chain amino acid transport system II carrier protein [Bacillota bacterium]